MNESSSIQLSKKALKNNIDFIKSRLGDNSEFVSIIKGNAYGHGIEKFVPMSYELGVKSFGVFTGFEAAIALKSLENFDRLLIMGYIDNAELEWAIENDIEFYVFDTDRLNAAIIAALKLKKKAKIHLEVETGMNRTGFGDKDLKRALGMITDNLDSLEIEGFCSHLAGAENIANHYRITRQIAKFSRLRKKLNEKGIGYKKAHLACSAAVMNYPKTIHDLARVGILQYGFWPSKETKMGYCVKNKFPDDPLDQVLSWKSKVMSLKSVKAGEYVGYGTSLLAEQDMKIATVPVGYADGFSRSLSNQGKVLIGGQRMDVVGIVNMNMVVVEVTNLEGVKRGDEVVLIGKQQDKQITVSSFSDLSSQLNYELLTRLPINIPRKIVD
ncbi:MAG: alanine racemase [Crocinitomicaceae bacterium]